MSVPIRSPLTDHCAACQLKSHAFFCDLPKTTMDDFESIKRSTAYPAHSLLFMEGEAPRGIFLLCHGRAKLYMTSAQGKMLLLRFADGGEILGLHAALSNRPYDATAEVLEPAQVAFVPQAEFLRFLERHAEACLKAARQLSDRCQDAFDQMRSIGLAHTAAEKLARLLLEWSSEGHQTPQGIRVEIHITQEEIAQLIGSSRETVNRLFSKFGSESLITLHGSTLLVHNPTALASLVNT